MEIFVGRQPILDDKMVTRAYELLFRDSNAGAAPVQLEGATGRLISHAFISMGVESVLGPLPGFLNVDRETLLSGTCDLLPPQQIVIELLETIEPDDRVVEACEKLHERGFLLALDDFVPSPGWRRVLPLASIIKLDFRATPVEELSRVRAEWDAPHMRFLAEKVETREEFEQARQLGFTLFQGYFFAKPVILSKREMPGHKLHCLRILAEARREEMRFSKLAEMIKTEISLSRRLLKFINSPLFDWLTPVTSIERALANLGEESTRRWLSIALLPQLSDGQSDHLWMMSLARARFCESMARQAACEKRQGDLFLMGLFSLLDTMMGMPIEEAIENLGLADDVRDFLCGRTRRGTLPAKVWALLESCESVDAGALERAAGGLRIRTEEVAAAWSDALSFSSETAKEMRHESMDAGMAGLSRLCGPSGPGLNGGLRTAGLVRR
jgi:EAL and modified HD-GYP domain-containing signal transduction protein